MNKKTIIQIVVIVIAFGASGFVLYNGLFKKPAPPTDPIKSISGNPADSSLMPMPVSGTESGPLPTANNGDLAEMFKVLNKNGLQFGFQYPELQYPSEIGIPVTELVRPIESEGQ